MLFLTSKVRLHCDSKAVWGAVGGISLFLTSKVRLHCDQLGVLNTLSGAGLFLTSKVRLHCDTPRRIKGAIPGIFS